MKLFNKDKDIMHRIANLVFVVWFVIATVTLYMAVIDLIIVKPAETYDSFKVTKCKSISDTQCSNNFQLQQMSERDEKHNRLVSSLNSIGNMVIVGVATYYINRPKKELKLNITKNKTKKK